MNNDVDMIVDLWSRLKLLIPKKERLEAADVIVAVMDEHGYADGLEDEDSLDKELLAAVKSHYGVDLDEDDEDECEDEY
jgi:isocitrate dehydrogenase kinase/phosphatase